MCEGYPQDIHAIFLRIFCYTIHKMVIYIGADHRGYDLKEKIKVALRAQGYEVEDKGGSQYDEQDDYPAYARSVAEAVSKNDAARGILLCGSGVGMDMAANKTSGVRCALGLNADQVSHARNSDNVNVLALAADYTKEDAALEMVRAFLSVPYEAAERQERRLRALKQEELDNARSNTQY